MPAVAELKQKILTRLSLVTRDAYNLLHPPRPVKITALSGLPEWDEVRRRAQTPTDINDHLETLFLEALRLKPRLILELGVRGGESTYALSRAARLTHSHLVSVDLDPIETAGNAAGWDFVQSDDIEFANIFPDWCQARQLEPRIDLLFIDTSHLYAHTRAEIQAWFPYLAPEAAVIFHDTHLKPFTFRKDGSLILGWNNQRGVIRALEDYFQRSFDETRDFIEIARGWLITHRAHCNGLTLLHRLPSAK